MTRILSAKGGVVVPEAGTAGSAQRDSDDELGATALVA